MTKKVFFILITLFCSLQVLANRHEHFSSWFLASSMTESYEEVYGESMENMKLDQLFATGKSPNNINIIERALSPEQWQRVIDYAQIEPEIVRKSHLVYPKVMAKIETIKYGEFLDIIGIERNDPERLKRLFKMPKFESRNMDVYSQLESLRNNFLGNLKNQNKVKYKDFLVKTIDKSVKQINVTNPIKVVSFSVPKELFGSELLTFSKAFRESGVDTDFFLSINRNTMVTENEERFSNAVKLLKRSLSEGWGNGADLTGSIREGSASPKSKSLSDSKILNLRNRFKLLGEELQHNGDYLLKIHAFEGTNDGVFYDELYRFIEELASKKGSVPTISFGHIKALSQEDIDHFVSIRERSLSNGKKLNIVFDANIESNLTLQDASTKELAQTIKKLHNAGFEVGIGSDGSGILGRRSSVDNQITKLIENDLPKEVAEKIRASSNVSPLSKVEEEGEILETVIKKKKAPVNALKMSPVQCILSGLVTQ